MKGVVTAGDSQTARAGAEILRMGGNAVDAATAAAFASFVAETTLVNAGGGGFAMISEPIDSPAGSNSNTVFYDFTCTVPSGQFGPTSDFREILVDFGDELQPFHIGRAATGVPGSPAGLCRMLADKGTMPLSQILAPAVRLAREGVILSQPLAYVLELLAPIFSATPQLKQRFFKDGTPLKAGERLVFPRFADTLERFGREGTDYYYRGELGRAIAQDQAANGGLISTADLAGYEVLRGKPITVPYRDATLLIPPPSSLGGVLIGLTLKLLETVDLEIMAPASPEVVRAFAEAMRLTNQARREWDDLPGDNQSKGNAFLAPKRLAHFRDLFHKSLKEKEIQPDPRVAKGPANTTHISVIDAGGSMVAITQSAGESSGYLVGDTGLLLNNFMGEADLHPHGFHRLPPGSRIMSMMSPVMVSKNGRPLLALGSAGSNRLRSAIVQVICNTLDFKIPLQEAICAPRVHYENGILQLEGGIDPYVAEAMRKLGYRVNAWKKTNVFFGGTQAVMMVDGQMVGGADPRRGGAVEIVT